MPAVSPSHKFASALHRQFASAPRMRAQERMP
jgi:hypothetical protein